MTTWTYNYGPSTQLAPDGALQTLLEDVSNRLRGEGHDSREIADTFRGDDRPEEAELRRSWGQCVADYAGKYLDQKTVCALFIEITLAVEADTSDAPAGRILKSTRAGLHQDLLRRARAGVDGDPLVSLCERAAAVAAARTSRTDALWLAYLEKVK